VSIIKRYKELDENNKFLIAYFLWALFIFGIFYWGKYWSYSPIGKIVDFYQREWIMQALEWILPNQISSYDIIINPKYHIVITPECNGLIPYFILLAAILAYPKRWIKKIKWAIIGLIIFNIANLLRLVVVVMVVNRYGGDSFFYIHDIVGNIFLMTIGALLFYLFLKDR